jgi:hypothetical protein
LKENKRKKRIFIHSIFQLEVSNKIIIMSMEAQFYEAIRRQHIIERRQSLGVSKQVQQPKYQSRYIADGALRQDDMHLPWPSNPLRRTKLATSEQNLHQTNEQSHL